MMFSTATHRSACSLVLAMVCSWALPASAAPIPIDELRGFLAPDFVSTAVPSIAWTSYLLPLELRSVLRMLHLLGLCLGLGAAIQLDINVLRWLRNGRVSEGAREMIRSGEQLVALGFALLWASGIALTALAVKADPAFLGNEKLWAKVLIVIALTANAVLLHAKVLPSFTASLARPLNGSWRGRERLVFMFAGAVSASSWGMAFALGVLREWNYVVGFPTILCLWLLAMMATWATISALLPKSKSGAAYGGVERRSVALP